jgi:hypothetical protein
VGEFVCQSEEGVNPGRCFKLRRSSGGWARWPLRPTAPKGRRRRPICCPLVRGERDRADLLVGVGDVAGFLIALKRDGENQT